MLNQIETIDAYAASIARNLDIVVYSLEGLYEKFARDNPTPQGVREFWSLADEVIASGIATALNSIGDGIDTLERSLSDSERVHAASLADYTIDRGVAQESFGAFFTQAKISYARRLREVVASRAFGIDTYNPDPRVMSRNGRRWNFSEYAYLTVRQLLVDWYNGVKIGYLAAMGVEEFTLLTEDPELIYTTYRVDEYPKIAGELFHPRTTKLVGGAHVPS